jgi:hypothetical protein
VYDAAGRQQAVLAHGRQPAGRYALSWNGSDARGRALASGLYFIRLETEGRKFLRKVVLAR